MRGPTDTLILGGLLGTHGAFMKAGHLAFVLLTTILVASILPWGGPSTTVTAQVSLTITMLDISFDTRSFSAEPGESVTIMLMNDGGIDHTFTLFAQVNATVPVNNPTDLVAYNSSNAKITPEVRLSRNEQMQIQFTAPSVQGDYTYVCMITGHAAEPDGMSGVMTVSSAAPPPTDTPGLDPLVLGIVIAVVVIIMAVAAVFILRRRS